LLIRLDSPHDDLPANAGEETIERLHKLRYAAGRVPTAQIRQDMQRTMQHHAAVFRTGDLMAEGVEKLENVNKSFGDVRLTDRSMAW